MPLSGDYEPGTSERSRKQVELYEVTGGREGADLRGRPVIILTSVGAVSGKLRKVALMRVEHDGAYAVVASLGGAPNHPTWYRNLKANQHVELQDGPVKRDTWPARYSAPRRLCGGRGRSRPGPTTRSTRAERNGQFPCSCWSLWPGRRRTPNS